jgi:GTP-binding protein
MCSKIMPENFMHLSNVSFKGSYNRESQCPKDNRPEFAFIGRSNVGKSSLINMLTQRKELAKVSKTPGKTQMLNYFNVEDQWYLVDLPGYGYARVSQTTRADWEKMIYYFLRNRQTLQCAFILLDSRHELQVIDRNFINWCGQNAVPIALIYTKIDKLKPNEVEQNISKIQNSLLEEWEELPKQFTTSAEKHIGRETVLSFISEVVHTFYSGIIT